MSDGTDLHVLRDGREMQIRKARWEDAETIAAAFPLPKRMLTTEEVYRSYFQIKTLIYVRAQCADVTCGFIDDQLAGYQFYCRDLPALRSFVMSPRNILWIAGQIIRGRFGYSPRFWFTCLRWGFQHFRQPNDYPDADQGVLQDCAKLRTWSRGVRTAEGFERIGVASTLMRHTENKLASEGARRMALWTAADNAPAIGLFEKMGFEKRGRMRRIGETCLLMVKDFDTGPH